MDKYDECRWHKSLVAEAELFIFKPVYLTVPSIRKIRWIYYLMNIFTYPK